MSNTESGKVSNLPGLSKLILVVIGLISFGASTIITVFLPYCENALKLPVITGDQLFSNWLTVFFIAPVFAGYIGQRFVGSIRSVIVGLSLGLIGELLLAFQTIPLSYVALTLFTLGVSLYTTNIYILFGKQFLKNDLQRSRAFVLLYVVMNTGAFLGDFSSGFFIKKLGYSMLFIIITIPKLIAIISFYIKTYTYRIEQPCKKTILVLFVLLGFFVCWFLIQHTVLLKMTAIILFVLCLFYFFKKSHASSEKSAKRGNIFIIFAMFILFYWGFYMLYPSVIEIYVEHHIAIDIDKMKLQPSTIAAFSPLFLIIFGLLLASLKRKNDSPLVIKHKIIGALFFIGLGFLLLICSVYAIRFHILFLGIIIAGYMLYALSEIFIGPVGFAMVGILVDEKLLGLMMGFTYLIHSVSGILTGYLTKLTEYVAYNYAKVFLFYGLIAVICSFVLLSIRYIRKGNSNGLCR